MYKPWHDEARRLQLKGMSAAAIARQLKQRYMAVYLFCMPQQRDKANAYYRDRYANDPDYRERKRAARLARYHRNKSKLDLTSKV